MFNARALIYPNYIVVGVDNDNDSRRNYRSSFAVHYSPKDGCYILTDDWGYAINYYGLQGATNTVKHHLQVAYGFTESDIKRVEWVAS